MNDFPKGASQYFAITTAHPAAPHKTVKTSVAAVLALLIAFLTAGCSGPKKAAERPATGPVPAEISLQTPQQRYAQLCAGYSDWQDVTMPVRISLSEPKSVSFSARATMKRNEWISLSVRMLGFELASVWIDNDSVHAIDKYHRLYLSESLTRFFAGADFTIGDVQDLLMGRGFIAGQKGGTFTLPMEQALNLSSTADGLFILPAENAAGFEYGFMLYPDSNNILAASVSVGEGNAGVATYSGFTATPQAGVFASTADFAIVKGHKASGSVSWSLGSAKWNSGESKSWKQPKGYRRIDASSLLKSITSL